MLTKSKLENLSLGNGKSIMRVSMKAFIDLLRWTNASLIKYVGSTSYPIRERSTKYILPGLLDSMGLFRFTQESSNGWSKSRGKG